MLFHMILYDHIHLGEAVTGFVQEHVQNVPLLYQVQVDELCVLVLYFIHSRDDRN